MDCLAICNTPFQIFNIINALVNKVEGFSYNNTDILIDITFKNARKIGNRIEEMKLCRRVYYVRKKDDYPIRTKFQCLVDLVKDELHEDYFDFSDGSVIKNHYDVIWVGDQNVLGLIAFRTNPNAKIFWYDDGAGSYSQTPESYGHKSLYVFFAKRLKLGCYRYNSRILFLNNKEIVQYDGYDLRDLPQYTDGNRAINILNWIFDYKKSESRLFDYRIVILTQVFPESAVYKGIDVHSLFLDGGIDFSKLLVRKHPRDLMDYSSCQMDSGENMWELECLNAVNDDHVLIACCSTAQLTPKIVGGKEPYIFFLHRFLLGNGSTVRDGFEKMIQKMIDMYSDKSKVLVPNTVEEFNEQFNKIMNRAN